MLKKLKQITVVGLGLLGGSITLAVLRSFSSIKTVGFAHRAVTRKKAKELHGEFACLNFPPEARFRTK